jgi:hypothetical protein
LFIFSYEVSIQFDLIIVVFIERIELAGYVVEIMVGPPDLPDAIGSRGHEGTV